MQTTTIDPRDFLFSRDFRNPLIGGYNVNISIIERKRITVSTPKGEGLLVSFEWTHTMRNADTPLAGVVFDGKHPTSEPTFFKVEDVKRVPQDGK